MKSRCEKSLRTINLNSEKSRTKNAYMFFVNIQFRLAMEDLFYAITPSFLFWLSFVFATKFYRFFCVVDNNKICESYCERTPSPFLVARVFSKSFFFNAERRVSTARSLPYLFVIIRLEFKNDKFANGRCSAMNGQNAPRLPAFAQKCNTTQKRATLPLWETLRA